MDDAPVMTAARLTLASRAVPSDAVVTRELDGETVLLNLDTGIYFGLDAVGTRIWSLLAAAEPLDRVLATLLAEYEVEAAPLEHDLLALVAQLRGKGLVTVSPPDPS
ncbi:MAG TPA: PqqD family protein [Vicinamibacterales bacterium]|nr:PqqD family protein [Vicinamibacterales bacterium]